MRTLLPITTVLVMLIAPFVRADEWEGRISAGWEERKARYLSSDARSLAEREPERIEGLNKPPQVITELKTFHPDTALVRDGRAESLIVHPDTPEYAELAQQVADAIQAASGVAIPIKSDRQYIRADREMNLICIGQLNNNLLARKLYIWRYIAADDWFPGPTGFELRTVSDPWGNGRNVILLGGSDLEGARRAADRFRATLPQAETLVFPYTIETQFEGIEHLEAFVEHDVQRLLGVVDQNHWNIDPPWLVESAQMYFLTGREAYLEAFVKLTRYWLHDYYRLWSFRQISWNKYATDLIRAYNLIEHSPAIPEALKLELTNLFHDYCTRLSRSARIRPLSVPGLFVRSGHHDVHKAVVYGADYFRKYYPDDDHEAIEMGLEKVRVGYETIAGSDGYLERGRGYTPYYPTAAMRTGLALGDEAYFTEGASRGWMRFIMAMTDASGRPMPGNRGRRIETLPIAAWHHQDPGYMGYLNWVMGRSDYTPKMTETSFYRWLWNYIPRIEPELPSHLTGINVAPLHKSNYLQIGSEQLKSRAHNTWDRAKRVNIPPERAFQMLTFREGLESGDQYLRIGGIHDGIHAHYGGDGNAVRWMNDNGRFFVDLARTGAPENHTTAVIGREGGNEAYRAHEQPALSDLQLTVDLRNTAFTRSVMHEYNGLDWARNIVWVKGRYWVFVDQFGVRESDLYNVRTQWLTAEPEADALGRFRRGNLVIQYAGGPDAVWERLFLRQNVEGPFSAGDAFEITQLVYGHGGGIAPYAVTRVGNGRVMVAEPARQVLIGVASLDRPREPLSQPEEALEVLAGIRAKCIMFTAAPDELSFAALTLLEGNGARLEADAPVDLRVDLARGTVTAYADTPALLRIEGLTVSDGGSEFMLDAWRSQVIASFEPGEGSPFGDAGRVRAALSTLAPHPESIAALAGTTDEPVADSDSETDTDLSAVQAGFATPLHRAAYRGNEEAVRRLVSLGHELEARDDRGRTPLILAGSMGHAMVIRLLVEAGADVNGRGGDGSTALHWAVYLAAMRDISAVRQLLALGADANARRANGVTPLHLAAAKGIEEAARMLVAHGADVNRLDDMDRTPLLRVIFGRGDLTALLVEAGADVNLKRADGSQAIHWAAARNRAAIVDTLLAAGAGLESRDDLGRTPLHWAAAAASDRVAELLLDQGADIDAVDARGRTPLERLANVRRVWNFADLELDPTLTKAVFERHAARP